MRATLQLLAEPGFPGFVRRSLDEFKRLSQVGKSKNTAQKPRGPCIRDFSSKEARGRGHFDVPVANSIHEAIKLEGLQKPQSVMPLWDFDNADAIKACTDMSDSDIGGSSQVNLGFVPASGSAPAHVVFSGNISNALPPDDLEVERTGYAAFRTRDRPRTLFGRALWDVDRYRYLALRLKSDGRKYKVNIQTESLVYTDIHQHRIYARRPGSWETVLIKWNDFVRTNHGIVVEPQSEMMKEKVRTIGIGLTDRLAGPFEMRISKMWATNGLTAEEIVEGEQPEVRYVPKHFESMASSAISKEPSRR